MMYALNERRRSLAGHPSLSEAERTELRVLLALFELDTADVKTIADAALCSKDEALSALQFWRGAGVVRAINKDEENVLQTAKEEKNTPHTALRHEMKLASMGNEHTAAIIERENLSSFLDACQQTAGQIFGAHEIEIAVGLFEQLGLSTEYILTLIAYCYGMSKRSMSYVEKVAFSFVLDQEIDTADKLNAHIAALDRMQSAEEKLRALFGIGNRAFSKKEKAAFFKWLNDFNYSLDVIEAAYDKTVNKTGKAPVSYADKILSHWHQCGCKTVKDAEELDARESSLRSSSTKKPKSTEIEKERESNITFDVEDFYNRALERSYGKAKKSDS